MPKLIRKRTMVVGVNYPAGIAGGNIGRIFGHAGFFQVELAFFVHFLPVGAFVEKLGRRFALGDNVVVNGAPGFVVALDIIGIVRTELNNGILMTNTVLKTLVTFGFAFFGVLIGIRSGGFVAAVRQKTNGTLGRKRK